MRRYLAPIARSGFALLLFGYGFGAGSTRAQTPTERPVWVGTGSCAATSCHNGRVDPTQQAGSEYAYWSTYDPHARAYSVLFEARSLRIEANLRQQSVTGSARPFADDLCLRCHVHQGLDSRAPEREVLGFAREDGAGCETCHGAASRWIVPHVLEGWKGLSVARKQVDYGFRGLSDLRVRAETCADCHVGTPSAEVNHDLIAAGHPRLTFDFAGQLAKLPKHWRASDDRARHPDLGARAWAVGRLVGARAALDLLAFRAEQATPKNSVTPWPEFAEYDCFSCHQAVQSRTRVTVGTGSPLTWGTWHFAALPGSRVELGLLPLPDPLQELRGLMVEPEPDPTRVARSARAMARLIDAQADRVNRAPVASDAVRLALREILNPPARPDMQGWEAAAQTYLGAVALRSTLAEFDARYRDPRIDAGLVAAYRDLNLPVRTPGGLQDSPARFDPDQIGRDWATIRDALPPTTPSGPAR